MKGKCKKYEQLDAENKIIWEKLLEIFEDHGASNTFKAMLRGIINTKYNDLDIECIIDTLFKRAKSYTYFEYLNDSDLDQIIEEVESSPISNFKVFKIESMAQEIKFENFLTDIAENPYQLKLIS